MVYLRVLIYMLLPLITMVPGITYSSEAGQLIIDLETALIAGTAAVAAGGGIFAIWGKK